MRGFEVIRGRRKSVVVPELLILAASASGLVFLRDETPGALFLFATLSPLLVVVAIVMLAISAWRHYRRRASEFVEAGKYQGWTWLDRHQISGQRGYSKKSTGARRVSASILVFIAVGLYPAPTRGNDFGTDKAVFEAKCEKCHGDDGRGNPAMARLLKLKQPFTPLSIAEVQGKSDEELKKIAINGLRTARAEMKPVKGGISETEAAAVVRYVRTLKP